MLQQIRHMLPDSWGRTRRAFGMEPPRLKQLKPGQTVRFGAMAQKELSGRSFQVNGVKAYEFPQGSFSAYSLCDQQKPVCWAIIADPGQGAPYLAISRKLSADDLESLLDDEDYQVLSHSSRLRQLYLREQTPGLKEWITMRYERRIGGMRGKQREGGTERVFEYELYVSEGDDRAIEIERFLDGHMDAYATIYRPISDVQEVLEPRPVAVKPVPESKPTTPKPPAKMELVKLKVAPPSAALPADASLRDVSETRKLLDRAPQKKPAPGATQQGKLECDLPTAWRLIDEALRGGMRLSDVVRKILGLPLQATELVSFSFSLHEDDYQALGRRYGVDPANRKEISACIVKELEAFAGKRPS